MIKEKLMRDNCNLVIKDCQRHQNGGKSKMKKQKRGKNILSFIHCPADRLACLSLALGSKPPPQKFLASRQADPENLVAICLWGENLFHFVAGSGCGTVVRTRISGAKLLRLWVRILPGAGLFSSLSIPQQCVLIKVPQGGATLLIFLH